MVQEAGGERVFALQREIAALEGDNRGLRQRCTDAEGRLQVSSVVGYGVGTYTAATALSLLLPSSMHFLLL